MTAFFKIKNIKKNIIDHWISTANHKGGSWLVPYKTVCAVHIGFHFKSTILKQNHKVKRWHI